MMSLREAIGNAERLAHRRSPLEGEGREGGALSAIASERRIVFAAAAARPLTRHRLRGADHSLKGRGARP
jgi:hypothetical protein